MTKIVFMTGGEVRISKSAVGAADSQHQIKGHYKTIQTAHGPKTVFISPYRAKRLIASKIASLHGSGTAVSSLGPHWHKESDIKAVLASPGNGGSIDYSHELMGEMASQMVVSTIHPNDKNGLSEPVHMVNQKGYSDKLGYGTEGEDEFHDYTAKILDVVNSSGDEGIEESQIAKQAHVPWNVVPGIVHQLDNGGEVELTHHDGKWYVRNETHQGKGAAWVHEKSPKPAENAAAKPKSKSDVYNALSAPAKAVFSTLRNASGNGYGHVSELHVAFDNAHLTLEKTQEAVDELHAAGIIGKTSSPMDGNPGHENLHVNDGWGKPHFDIPAAGEKVAAEEPAKSEEKPKSTAAEEKPKSESPKPKSFKMEILGDIFGLPGHGGTKQQINVAMGEDENEPWGGQYDMVYPAVQDLVAEKLLSYGKVGGHETYTVTSEGAKALGHDTGPVKSKTLQEAIESLPGKSGTAFQIAQAMYETPGGLPNGGAGIVLSVTKEIDDAVKAGKIHEKMDGDHGQFNVYENGKKVYSAGPKPADTGPKVKTAIEALSELPNQTASTSTIAGVMHVDHKEAQNQLNAAVEADQVHVSEHGVFPHYTLGPDPNKKKADAQDDGKAKSTTPESGPAEKKKYDNIFDALKSLPGKKGSMEDILSSMGIDANPYGDDPDREKAIDALLDAVSDGNITETQTAYGKYTYEFVSDPSPSDEAGTEPEGHKLTYKQGMVLRSVRVASKSHGGAVTPFQISVVSPYTEEVTNSVIPELEKLGLIFESKDEDGNPLYSASIKGIDAEMEQWGDLLQEHGHHSALNDNWADTAPNVPSDPSKWSYHHVEGYAKGMNGQYFAGILGKNIREGVLLRGGYKVAEIVKYSSNGNQFLRFQCVDVDHPEKGAYWQVHSSLNEIVVVGDSEFEITPDLPPPAYLNKVFKEAKARKINPERAEPALMAAVAQYVEGKDSDENWKKAYGHLKKRKTALEALASLPGQRGNIYRVASEMHAPRGEASAELSEAVKANQAHVDSDYKTSVYVLGPDPKKKSEAASAEPAKENLPPASLPPVKPAPKPKKPKVAEQVPAAEKPVEKDPSTTTPAAEVEKKQAEPSGDPIHDSIVAFIGKHGTVTTAQLSKEFAGHLGTDKQQWHFLLNPKKGKLVELAASGKIKKAGFGKWSLGDGVTAEQPAAQEPASKPEEVSAKPEQQEPAKSAEPGPGKTADSVDPSAQGESKPEKPKVTPQLVADTLAGLPGGKSLLSGLHDAIVSAIGGDADAYSTKEIIDAIQDAKSSGLIHPSVVDNGHGGKTFEYSVHPAEKPKAAVISPGVTIPTESGALDGLTDDQKKVHAFIVAAGGPVSTATLRKEFAGHLETEGKQWHFLQNPKDGILVALVNAGLVKKAGFGKWEAMGGAVAAPAAPVAPVVAPGHVSEAVASTELNEAISHAVSGSESGMTASEVAEEVGIDEAIAEHVMNGPAGKGLEKEGGIYYKSGQNPSSSTFTDNGDTITTHDGFVINKFDSLGLTPVNGGPYIKPQITDELRSWINENLGSIVNEFLEKGTIESDTDDTTKSAALLALSMSSDKISASIDYSGGNIRYFLNGDESKKVPSNFMSIPGGTDVLKWHGIEHEAGNADGSIVGYDLMYCLFNALKPYDMQDKGVMEKPKYVAIVNLFGLTDALSGDGKGLPVSSKVETNIAPKKTAVEALASLPGQHGKLAQIASKMPAKFDVAQAQLDDAKTSGQVYSDHGEYYLGQAENVSEEELKPAEAAVEYIWTPTPTESLPQPGKKAPAKKKKPSGPLPEEGPSGKIAPHELNELLSHGVLYTASDLKKIANSLPDSGSKQELMKDPAGYMAALGLLKKVGTAFAKPGIGVWNLLQDDPGCKAVYDALVHASKTNDSGVYMYSLKSALQDLGYSKLDYGNYSNHDHYTDKDGNVVINEYNGVYAQVTKLIKSGYIKQKSKHAFSYEIADGPGSGWTKNSQVMYAGDSSEHYSSANTGMLLLGDESMSVMKHVAYDGIKSVLSSDEWKNKDKHPPYELWMSVLKCFDTSVAHSNYELSKVTKKLSEAVYALVSEGVIDKSFTENTSIPPSAIGSMIPSYPWPKSKVPGTPAAAKQAAHEVASEAMGYTPKQVTASVSASAEAYEDAVKSGEHAMVTALDIPAVTVDQIQHLLHPNNLVPVDFSGQTMLKSKAQVGGTVSGEGSGLYEVGGKKYLLKHAYDPGKSHAPFKYWNDPSQDSTGQEHARSEVLATMLAAVSGVPSPTNRFGDLTPFGFPGKLGVAAEWIDGITAGKYSDKSWREKAQDQFAVHAWLGNWDVVGASQDNMVTGMDGDPFCIDWGGSLLFRAQGKKKGSEFGTSVGEWDTFRGIGGGGNQSTLFGDMTPEQMLNSAKRVVAISDDVIRELVGMYGPKDKAERDKLAQTLILRKKDIESRALAIVNSEALEKIQASKMKVLQSTLGDYVGRGWAGVSATVASISKAFKWNLTSSVVEILQSDTKADTSSNVTKKGKHFTLWGFFANLSEAAGHEKTRAFASEACGIDLDKYDLNSSGLSQPAGAAKKTKRYKLGSQGEAQKAAYNALPTNQKKALYSYSGGGYTGLNLQLRLGKWVSQAAYAISGFKACAKECPVLPVGSYTERGFSLHAEAIANIKANVGVIIADPGFSSSSTHKPWSGNVVLCIHSGPGAKGLDVTQWGQLGSAETELLYGPGQRFMVLGMGYGPDMNGTKRNLLHVIALPAETDNE